MIASMMADEHNEDIPVLRGCPMPQAWLDEASLPKSLSGCSHSQNHELRAYAALSGALSARSWLCWFRIDFVSSLPQLHGLKPYFLTCSQSPRNRKDANLEPHYLLVGGCPYESANCSSYFSISLTLSALALLSSNLRSTHSSTSFFASSNPMTL